MLGYKGSVIVCEGMRVIMGMIIYDECIRGCMGVGWGVVRCNGV